MELLLLNKANLNGNSINKWRLHLISRWGKAPMWWVGDLQSIPHKQAVFFTMNYLFHSMHLVPQRPCFAFSQSITCPHSFHYILYPPAYLSFPIKLHAQFSIACKGLFQFWEMHSSKFSLSLSLPIKYSHAILYCTCFLSSAIIPTQKTDFQWIAFMNTWYCLLTSQTIDLTKTILSK